MTLSQYRTRQQLSDLDREIRAVQNRLSENGEKVKYVRSKKAKKELLAERTQIILQLKALREQRNTFKKVLDPDCKDREAASIIYSPRQRHLRPKYA